VAWWVLPEVLSLPTKSDMEIAFDVNIRMPAYTYPLINNCRICSWVQRYSTVGDLVPIFRLIKLLKINVKSFFPWWQEKHSSVVNVNSSGDPWNKIQVLSNRLFSPLNPAADNLKNCSLSFVTRDFWFVMLNRLNFWFFHNLLQQLNQ